MKMKPMRQVLVLHVLLMLLASTEFTIVTALFGGRSMQWCWYRYVSRSGFGSEFVPDYSLPIIAVYLVAFAFGIAGFGMSLQRGRSVAGFLGAALSVVGLISFAIEASHWISEHHRSWIAISPLAMYVLSFLRLFTASAPNGGTTDP